MLRTAAGGRGGGGIGLAALARAAPAGPDSVLLVVLVADCGLVALTCCCISCEALIPAPCCPLRLMQQGILAAPSAAGDTGGRRQRQGSVIALGLGPSLANLIVSN